MRDLLKEVDDFLFEQVEKMLRRPHAPLSGSKLSMLEQSELLRDKINRALKALPDDSSSRSTRV